MAGATATDAGIGFDHLLHLPSSLRCRDGGREENMEGGFVVEGRPRRVAAVPGFGLLRPNWERALAALLSPRSLCAAHVFVWKPCFILSFQSYVTEAGKRKATDKR